MDLKGATSCGRCAGTRRVSERERASASLGPDPQASVSLLLGLQCCFWPPQVEGGRGGAVHTLSRPCSMLFSLLTQTQVTVSMLAEQEVCFFPTRWTVPV